MLSHAFLAEFLRIIVSLQCISSSAFVHSYIYIKIEMVSCALCSPVERIEPVTVIALAFCLAAENKVKAGQLRVMEALLNSLTLHKASATVAEAVAGAFTNICVHGMPFVPFVQFVSADINWYCRPLSLFQFVQFVPHVFAHCLCSWLFIYKAVHVPCCRPSCLFFVLPYMLCPMPSVIDA